VAAWPEEWALKLLRALTLHVYQYQQLVQGTCTGLLFVAALANC